VQIRNANDAISSAQTDDGYLAQITENLQRISEVLSGAGNTAGTVETAALALENVRINGLISGAAPSLAAVSGATDTAANVALDLTAVMAARADFGAIMAQKASEVATLQTASVNLSASYSRIMDTDYAAETAAQAKNNILQQAGTAVLAQANQTPQTVLTLLR
jgi:flagellin